MIGDAHTYPLIAGDAFILKFGFPIRVNGKVLGGCTNLGGVAYGDAIYHERLRTVVCKIPIGSTMTIPAQLTPAANVQTFYLKNFYTPWYFLATT